MNRQKHIPLKIGRLVSLIIIVGFLAAGLNNFTRDLSPFLLVCNTIGFGIFLILWAKLLKDIYKSTKENNE